MLLGWSILNMLVILRSDLALIVVSVLLMLYYAQVGILFIKN